MSNTCAATIYRSRNPEATSLYKLIQAYYDEVKGYLGGLLRAPVWPLARLPRPGRALLRGLWCLQLLAVPACAVPSAPLSTSSRSLVRSRTFCPSCAAKRAAVFGAYLADEVLAEVGHAQWVLTIPKMLRPYFLHHRELLGNLCQAAWETVAELVDAAAGDGAQIRPGMVAVLQTARSDLAFSPHIHALATRGGWTHDGRWVPVPFVDTDAAEKLFQPQGHLLPSGRGSPDRGADRAPPQLA